MKNTWQGSTGLVWSLVTLDEDNRPEWMRALDVRFIELNGKEVFYNPICRLRFDHKYGSYAGRYYFDKEKRKAEEEALFDSWQRN